MKKGMFGFVLGSLLFCISLFSGEEVYAENQINNLDIQIELQEDGSGVVTETRDMYVDDGTELYITMNNLQDSAVLDFSVEGFTPVEEWDSDDSMEEKAGNYGVIEDGDDLELVWGMGGHGENTYEVTYTLSNLVRELEDGQGLLWNFDTFSDIPAENVTVEISGHQPFTEDNVRFWGFGFEGDMEFSGDNILWEANETLENNDVTTLLQFPSGMFNTSASVDMTLEEQREMAMDGSSYNNPPTPGWVWGLLGAVGTLGLAGLGTGITYAVKLSNAKKEAGQMKVGGERYKQNEGMYYEQIPYSGDIADIAYLLQQGQTGYFENYFAAYLLSWVNSDRIDIHTEEKSSFFEKKHETEIEIFDYEAEKEKYGTSFKEYVNRIKAGENPESYDLGMWLMLLDAADGTGLIDDDTIKSWAKDHAKEVEEYADYLEDYSKRKLEQNGLVTFDTIKVWGQESKIAVASNEGEELFDRLIQFKNHIENANIENYVDDSKEISFTDLLIWASVFGENKTINDQFENLVPEPDQDSSAYIYPYWYWYGTHGFCRNYSEGLASGGFSSAASSGLGGATSAGGGGGGAR